MVQVKMKEHKKLSRTLLVKGQTAEGLCMDRIEVDDLDLSRMLPKRLTKIAENLMQDDNVEGISQKNDERFDREDKGRCIAVYWLDVETALPRILISLGVFFRNVVEYWGIFNPNDATKGEIRSDQECAAFA